MIIIASMSMAGAILVIFFGCAKLRILLHISWCLICVFLIIGFLLTGLLMTFSVFFLRILWSFSRNDFKSTRPSKI